MGKQWGNIGEIKPNKTNLNHFWPIQVNHLKSLSLLEPPRFTAVPVFLYRDSVGTRKSCEKALCL